MTIVEDGCVSFCMVRTRQSYSSVLAAGTSSVAMVCKVLLVMLTSMSLPGTSIFYASVAKASACRLCARDLCSNRMFFKDLTSFWLGRSQD